MSEFIKFIDNMIEERISDLHTCMLGRIENFDPVKMKATVKPLLKRKFKGKQAEDLPLITEVPVSLLKAGPFYIRPPYQKGDIVLLVFSERALDNVIANGVGQDPESNRKHSLDDAIIISGIMPFNQSLPSEHGDDLLIGKTDGSVKVVIKNNNDITVETKGNASIHADGSLSITSGDDMTITKKLNTAPESVIVWG